MSACRHLSPDEQYEIYQAMLGRKYGLRDAAWFIFGCQTGFRISEILSIHRRHLITVNGKLRNTVTIHQAKTGKPRTVALTKITLSILEVWLSEAARLGYIRGRDFVFQSPRSSNMPLNRSTACRILQQMAAACNITGPIGTHSMRKTFAQNLYRHFLARQHAGELVEPLLFTSLAIGHSNQETTRKYLALANQQLAAAVRATGDVWLLSQSGVS